MAVDASVELAGALLPARSTPRARNWYWFPKRSLGNRSCNPCPSKRGLKKAASWGALGPIEDGAGGTFFGLASVVLEYRSI